MKTDGESEGIAPRILDLSTRLRRVVSFTTRPLYPQGKSPGTRWIGGWVGPRAVLNTKVVPVLSLTDHHAMKAYWGSGGIASRIF
jgi:hypothetical protein